MTRLKTAARETNHMHVREKTEMILCHTHKVIYILYFRGPIGGFWASRLGEKLMENRIFLGKIDGIRDI